MKPSDLAKKEVFGKINTLMRACGFEATRRIMLRTPVDLGRARGNWNASVNTPDVSVDDDVAYKRSKKKDQTGKVAGTSRDSKKITQAHGVAQKTDFAKGDRFYLSNGLPYIGALEGGSSTQAPNGMVSLTIAELKPWVDAEAEKIRGK